MLPTRGQYGWSGREHAVLTIFRFGTVTAEMAILLAVAAGNIVHVLRLVALFGYMAFLTTIATGSATTLWTIFTHMALWNKVRV